jgi:lipopolysaccharide transport system ATP-binding protein
MLGAITVHGLGKRFRRYTDQPATLKELLLRGWRGRRPAEWFWGLRDVSFSVAPGRMVGVVGANGAGKSTLLRLIGGVGLPDEGSVKTTGRIGALLDLGAGFHPDLTGRENVFITGVIAGLTQREIVRRFDEIVAFAELEAFIDSPLRTYSSGMQMRLAFAVAAHTEPDILLIDEVLAVGDLAFQRKCIQRIAQFKSDGCTIVLVSHDPGQIRRLCAGRLVAHGTADVIVEQYVAEMSAETRRRTPTGQPAVRLASDAELQLHRNRFGSLELEITAVRLLGRRGLPTAEFDSGEPVRVEIDCMAPQPIRSPIFSVSISREDGAVCYDASTAMAGLALPTIQGFGRIALQIDRLDLAGGLYYLDIGAYERDWTYAYDYHWHVYPLIIRPTAGVKGILCPPHQWEFDTTCGSIPVIVADPVRR